MLEFTVPKPDFVVTAYSLLMSGSQLDGRKLFLRHLVSVRMFTSMVAHDQVFHSLDHFQLTDILPWTGVSGFGVFPMQLQGIYVDSQDLVQSGKSRNGVIPDHRSPVAFEIH
jgi:hypothetical protein